VKLVFDYVTDCNIKKEDELKELEDLIKKSELPEYTYNEE